MEFCALSAIQKAYLASYVKFDNIDIDGVVSMKAMTLKGCLIQ